MDKKYIKIGLIAAGCILLFWGLQEYELLFSGLAKIFELATPLIIGFCMAFILGVPLQFLEKHFFPKSKRKWVCAIRRPLCIILSLVIIILILTLVINLVVPELIGAFTVLANSIPVFLEQAQKWALDRADNIPALESWIASLNIPWNEAGKTLFSVLKASATGLLDSTFAILQGTFTGVVDFVVAFIFALYILLGKEKLKSQCTRMMHAYLPEARVQRITEIIRLTRTTFANFITGQCTEAVILGTLCWLGMSIFGFPYAPMVGALIGLTALIPVVGAFVGGFVGGFMIFMVNPVQTIWFVVFILVLQQLENNLIYPRVVGTSVGLPAMWVLVAVIVGGGLFGVIGMLFGVPTVSILYTLLRENVSSRLAVKAKAAQQQALSESEQI